MEAACALNFVRLTSLSSYFLHARTPSKTNMATWLRRNVNSKSTAPGFHKREKEKDVVQTRDSRKSAVKHVRLRKVYHASSTVRKSVSPQIALTVLQCSAEDCAAVQRRGLCCSAAPRTVLQCSAEDCAAVQR